MAVNWLRCPFRDASFFLRGSVTLNRTFAKMPANNSANSTKVTALPPRNSPRRPPNALVAEKNSYLGKILIVSTLKEFTPITTSAKFCLM